jgi:hypothetical protein
MHLNQEPWTKILQFDLDSPMSEYGFSTRLANENYWTKEFTRKAIVEYKKFMYLAATSDFMVSPSEIVDQVWHEHLIFTQSYTDFCRLLGKTIQHVPSTHNKDEFEKFMQAKERTRKFYASSFGEMPKEIWEYTDMFESLHLSKAKLKVRTFIIIGILVLIALVTPFYHLLRPLFLQIDNPYFLTGFSGLSIAVLVSLSIFNRRYLRKIVEGFHSYSFVYSLHPMELIYLQNQNLREVVHCTVNELVEERKIRVNDDNTIERGYKWTPETLEEFQVSEALDHLGQTYYPSLMHYLVLKPVFWNIANSMDAFKKYFIKSKVFGKLFYFNFSVLALLQLFAFIRLSIGLIRGVPVGYIFFANVVLLAIIIVYLLNLTNLIGTVTIPRLYKHQLLPDRTDNGNAKQWQYFLLGRGLLAASFLPLVTYVDKHNRGSDSSSGGSCGSSCGSSCGGGCGGCGGD